MRQLLRVTVSFSRQNCPGDNCLPSFLGPYKLVTRVGCVLTANLRIFYVIRLVQNMSYPRQRTRFFKCPNILVSCGTYYFAVNDQDTRASVGGFRRNFFQAVTGCLSTFLIRFTCENTKSCDVKLIYPQDIVDFQASQTQDMVYSESSNHTCTRKNVAYKNSNTRDMRET